MNLELLTFLGTAPQSNEAARFAEAAGEQDLLWNFAREFFLHQGNASSAYATQEFIQSIAAKVPSMDVPAAASSALTRGAEEEFIAAERIAARHHINGVPAVLIRRSDGRGREVILGLGDVREYEAAIRGLMRDRGKPLR
jgi:predicted DsbA family dithiol-disulfide isomerase